MSLSSETSSHLSATASMASIDLGTYQESLEAVLGWLLEAEDTLLQQGDIAAEDVNKVKEQFHTHEVCFGFGSGIGEL